ncbi:nuclease-related domain-containing protein [Geomicrobium sp. JSM 1781026]|uniref:nuclease-related domain-containing protein n=1 Tax=Geomicrobium sp. JSM 1781026 TaxID=3344580 RepID=UPI0035C08D51
MDEREKSAELTLLRLLNKRMRLDAPEHLHSLEKGFVGECQLDKWLNSVTSDCIILNDLWLQYKQSLFQVDTLIIFPEKIFILDAKNYSGDYKVDGDYWSTLRGHEIKNPLHQLQRCVTLLRQLLQSFGYTLPIEYRLMFMNPEFMLYQAPPQLPAVFTSQLDRFLCTLNASTAPLSKSHHALAAKLTFKQLTTNPFALQQSYSYDQLRKGVVCLRCPGMMERRRRYFQCMKCEAQESVHVAISRSIHEFVQLFPERKLTTSAIFDWCGGEGERRFIRNLLIKTCTKKGSNRGTYFIARHKQ